MLDEAARDSRLWDRARGRPWRWSYEDVAHLFTIAIFVAMALWGGAESVSPAVLGLVLGLGAVSSWKARRLDSRVDALGRLLQKEKGRVQ